MCPHLRPDGTCRPQTRRTVDRAEARDFTDVYALAKRYDKTQLLTAAHAVDPGFDRAALATMFDSLTRLRDTDLPIPAKEVTALRTFFATWAPELRIEQGLGRSLEL